MISFMRMNLELEGCRVISATNGREALERARDDLPDLILLDIMMPGMDGFEVLRRLRESTSVPVIVLTAKDGRLGTELTRSPHLVSRLPPIEFLLENQINGDSDCNFFADLSTDDDYHPEHRQGRRSSSGGFRERARWLRGSAGAG